MSDAEHEALHTRYGTWRDEALAAPLRAVVEAADETNSRYDAMYGEPVSAHPDLPELTQPLDPAMARLLARLVEDDGYVTDSERHNLRTLLPLLRVHCRAWDYATPTPQTEPAGPAGDNDEADAQYEFTFGESARAYHPPPTPVPAPSPPTAMPPPTANIMPNAIERGAATLMHTDGTPLNNAEWAAVRRPLAPALQRLIMSSAPMRNDGTYDMTEQERLAQRARYRRITGAAQPAAVPPPAADDARSATASNGAHVGEARVPAPNADTSDADAPTPPPADTSARSALLRSRSPPARNERTRNQRHSRERRHRVLLELLAYEEGLLQDAWAADRFGVERTLSLQGGTLSLYPPTPGPPPPAPAAMPPVAAGATSNASARPHVDPHGNGVRIGEADTPAPAADDSDANTPAPPTASTNALDPILVQLFARLVSHVFGNVTPDERRALDVFCRDWRPAMAPAPAPSPHADARERASANDRHTSARSGASARRNGRRRVAASPASTPGLRRTQPGRIAADNARRRHAAEQRRVGRSVPQLLVLERRRQTDRHRGNQAARDARPAPTGWPTPRRRHRPPRRQSERTRSKPDLREPRLPKCAMERNTRPRRPLHHARLPVRGASPR